MISLIDRLPASAWGCVKMRAHYGKVMAEIQEAISRKQLYQKENIGTGGWGR